MRRQIAVIGAVAGLLASGCGGGSSSGTSAGSYVRAVCAAVRDWTREIEARTSALHLASITNTKQGKAAIQQFLRGAVADTGAAVAAMRSAGTPAVANGNQISATVVSSFAEIDAALTRGQKQAAALPTDDPSAFRDRGRALAGSVQRALTSISSGLSGLGSPEVAKAAQKEPACAAPRA